MKQKKLMLLGGSRYLMPVVNVAHKLGLRVITCDYVPENYAHQFADEYYNISVMDCDAVLAKAKELEIDGVMAFGCDAGVVAAAYVAEEMSLPFQCSYEAAQIFQDKWLFRKFLTDHGFNCPRARMYDDKDVAIKESEEWRHESDGLCFPIIVKPVDSCGSKGCSRVDSPDDLAAAIDAAWPYCHKGHFIVEEFITFESYHSSTDPFTVDGKLCAVSYSDQLFDKEASNPYTPAFIVWPTTMKQEHQDYLTRELQRLMDLLHVKNGIYNIETVIGEGGVPYIMEVSPRGGGCKIAELQEMAFCSNVIENEVRKAVGMPLLPIEERPIQGCWCEMIIHARPGQQGAFDSLVIRDDIRKNNVRVIDMSAKKGDIVHPFTGANMSLGDMFLQFDSREELDEKIADTTKWMEIKLS